MRFLFLSGILLLSSAASASLSPQLLNAELGIQMSASIESLYKEVREVCNVVDEFSGKFILGVAKRNRKNFIVSPLTTALGLIMVSIAATGDSETKLLNVIPLNENRVQRIQMFNSITKMLNSYKAVELNVINGLFVSSEFVPNPNLVKLIGMSPHSSVRSVDFREPQKVTDFINAWSKYETNGRIEEIVNRQTLSTNMALMLINALSFNARWSIPFETEFDARPFTLADGGKKNMTMMTSRNFYHYGYDEEMGAKFIQIPYMNENNFHNISMFIILPTETDGFANLEKNIHKVSIRRLLELRRRNGLQLTIPKFQIQSDIVLDKILAGMGLEFLFDEGSANLAGLSSGYSAHAPRYPPSLTRVTHKAVIGADEKGTEAVAVNSLYLADRSFIQSWFQVDRPFYAIVATTGAFPLNILTARFTGLE